MVYAGTVTVTKVAKNILKIHASDFDADAEFTTVDLSAYRMEGASNFTMHVIRTAGATDVVEVKLQASNNGGYYGDILVETGVNANGWSAVADKACKRIKIYITTIGAGNTLDVYIYATING